MAVVAITPTQMVSETAVVVTANEGVAIVNTNTNTILYPKDGDLLLKIQSSHADTAVTIEASDYAIGSGQGSITYAVGNGVTHLVVVGASSRFKKSAGYITLSYAANSAGYIQALYLPPVVKNI